MSSLIGSFRCWRRLDVGFIGRGWGRRWDLISSAESRQRVEDAVDECRRILRRELARKFDGLIDCYFWRRAGELDLINGEPEDVAVERRHPLDRPVLRVAFQNAIDFAPVFADAF